MMKKFRVTITVHKDYIVDVEVSNKEQARDLVNANMGFYIDGVPADYSFSEITDVEEM